MNSTEDYVAPPPTLLSRNPFVLLKYFGAGAFLASITIGSGELLFPSRLGAMFGFQLLWMFPLVAVLKWAMSYSSARHFVLSGAHPLERWNEIPGPRGWLPLFFFSIFISCAPFLASFMASLLGNISSFIFPRFDLYIWASVWILVCFVLLVIGSYDFIERAQLLILSVMVVCVIVAVAYARPDWLGVLQGSLVPQMPEYPAWVLDKYEGFRSRSLWLELGVAAAVTGGGSHDYLCYVALLREKTWGRSQLGIADKPELERIAADVNHPARKWIKAARIDSTLSMILVVVIALCFAILASVVLEPQHLVPEKDHELLIHQAEFLTRLSPWLLPIYKLAVFLAFFGSVYGGPELVSRVSNEFFRSVPGDRWKFSPKAIRWFAMIWTLCGSLAVLWVKRAFPDTRIVDFVTFPVIYTGIVLCGVYCFVNPWADYKFLPTELRMHPILALLNIAAGLIYFWLGFQAIWGVTWEQPFGWNIIVRPHLVILPIWIMGTMAAAHCLFPKQSNHGSAGVRTAKSKSKSDSS